MNPTDLIQELETLGVRIWEDDGRLHFRAPKGALTGERRAELAAHKEALLDHIRAGTIRIVAHPEARHDAFPTTDVQAAYLTGRRKSFLYGGVGCHAYGELALPEVDPARMTAAWRYLICRHDMLRAVFRADGSQEILVEVPDYDIAAIDLRGADGEARERALQATRAEMDHRVYDPAIWPLFDLRISRLDGSSRLHVSIDFLIVDYISIFILLAELRFKYENPNLEMPLPPATFRDYLLAQRGSNSGYVLERDSKYWLDRIETFPFAPDLPVREQELDGNEHVRFRRWEFKLTRDAWNSLAQEAIARGLTPSSAVLAAYAEVIGRWSRAQHFALNVTVVNRPPLPELGAIIGDFTTINLLEVDQRSPSPFIDRARNLQHRLGQDMDHGRFSGVQMIRELVRRRGARDALMPVVFTSTLGLARDTVDIPMGDYVGGISQTPQVWIDCQAMTRNNELAINWDVREGVFAAGMIDTMFAAFEAITRRLAAGADWDSECPIQLPPDQAARRAAANRTEGQRPEGTLVSAALSWATRDPQRVCVIAQSNPFTYGEVLRHAGAVKAELEDSGVKPGEIVAVLAEQGLTQVVAVLAILLAGAAFLPLDAAEPPARRNRMLADACVRYLVSDITDEVPVMVRKIHFRELRPCDVLPEPIPVSPDQIAYIIYTSGSTGSPKGVMISHRAALNTIADVNARFAITGTDRILSVSSLAFDLSVYDVFGMLAVGGAIILPDAELRSDPSHWARLIGQYRVTIWNSVPGLMSTLLEYLAIRSDLELASMRLALLSGDRIAVELVKRIQDRLSGLQIIALGGATEASIWSIYFPLCELCADARAVPYGRALANQTMHVLDQALRPCPESVVGEIYIGGAGLALGYYGDLERTHMRFISDPNGRSRLYRTGDLGRCLADGNIEILGRDDAQVKIRGYRVELGEIEATLNEYRGVAQAVAVVTGEESRHRRLLAFVEAAPDRAEAAPNVATEAQKAAATVLQNHDLANILQYADALDRAALASMLQAFRGAGLFANGQVQTSEQIVAALSVHARYRRLLRRWLNAACEHGVLVRERVHDDIGYRLTSSGLRLAAAREWELVERWPHCYDPPELLSYFRACGMQLPALISGKQSALQLFYPEGRSDVPLGLYEHAFFNRWGNQVTAAVVRVLADATARGRPIRLLEIGAGQGGLTDCVLGALDKDYDYVVSEISEYFLAATRNKFKDNASVHFARYDLNLGYRDQGIAPNSFDIIVVGDTLHIARNVPKALTELREILTPGGWLVAMEMVRDHCQIMTSLEFLNATDDAGPTYDDDREFRDQTFFTRDQWLELLQQSEADIVEVAPRSDEIIAEVGVCVFAARYKPGRAVLSAKQLTEFLRIRLPDYMVPNEIQIVDRIPLTVNGKVDRVRLANSPIAPPVGAGSADLIGDDLTRRIASIWATVLGHAPGADTEFFSAGGDSLLAAQLAGQICEKVPEADAIYFDELLRRVLEGPTLAALAQIVRAAGAPGSAPHANERPEGRTVEGDGLICLGGALGQPVCVLISDEEGQQACTDSLKRALVDRCRVYELPIGSVDRDIPREAMRFHFLIRNANLSDPHLVGFGGGNLIAVELGRQMLEDGDIRPTVTVTSLTPGLMTGHDAATVHYAGDINLLCFGRDFRAEAYWRNACLGDLKITELRNLDSLHIASFLAAPSGK